MADLDISTIDPSRKTQAIQDNLKNFYNNLGHFSPQGDDVFIDVQNIGGGIYDLTNEELRVLRNSRDNVIKVWSKNNGYDLKNQYDYYAYSVWADASKLDPHDKETFRKYQDTDIHKMYSVSDKEARKLYYNFQNEYGQTDDEYIRDQAERERFRKEQAKLKAEQNQKDQTEQELNDNPQAEPVTEETQQQKEEIKAEQQNPEQEALDTAGSEANIDAVESSSPTIEKEVAETVPKTTEEVSEIASTIADTEQKLAEQAQDVVENTEKTTDGLATKELSGKGKLALGIAAVILITTTSASRSANKGKDGDKPKEADLNKQWGYSGGMTTQYYANLQKQNDLELASDISSYTYGNRRR